MGLEIVPVADPMRLHEELILSGPIGGPPGRDDRFVIRRQDDLVADPFADELFVMARGQAGWTVLTGCCHRGLVNTLRLAKYLAHQEPIAAVVGGLHLRQADAAELTAIAEALDKLGQPALHPGHCTGSAAIQHFRDHYGGKCEPLRAGMRLRI